MLIRHGERRDAENLSALAIQVWLHTYATEGISPLISRYVLSEFTPEKFEALLSNDSSTVLVAESNENLVGYATVSVGKSCPVPTSQAQKSNSQHCTYRRHSSEKVSALRSSARQRGRRGKEQAIHSGSL